MGPGKTCLSAIVASLVISEMSLLATEADRRVVRGAISAADAAVVQLAQPAGNGPQCLRLVFADRPADASVGRRQSTGLELPSRGRRGHHSERRWAEEAGSARRHASAHRTREVYDIKVITVPQAAVGLHARAVLLISEAALTLVDADELQALLAHEIGHEYVWAERERAFQLADRNGLKDLELVCDAIAIVTLYELGMDVSRLMTGIQKISRFNRERLGTAQNERDYPTVAERRAFAGRLPRGHQLELRAHVESRWTGGRGAARPVAASMSVL